MTARLDPEFLAGAREAVAASEADGWLLYDLEGRNPITTDLLGLAEGLSRRYFVLLRPEGDPAVLAHRIEQQPWEGWRGPVASYVGWEEMERRLAELLRGCDRVAMEVSPRDEVPFVDHVPAGMRDLVASLGVDVVSSAELLSRTYAQWGPEGRSLHDRAGRVLAEVARAAFARCGGLLSEGRPPSEHGLGAWVRERCGSEGLVEVDTIVAFGPNTANPHYEPPEEGSRVAREGDVFLLDLWGKVGGAPRAVFADQTWMGVLAPSAGKRLQATWEAVRDARDRTVEFLRERWAAGEVPSGADADRAAREVLRGRGMAEGIQHRTGHGIDRALHGFGPNLDSVETRDTRRLLEGVGFSVEPGLYFEGELGVRSEINVHVGPDGPEVTTPAVQDEPWTLDGEA